MNLNDNRHPECGGTGGFRETTPDQQQFLPRESDQQQFLLLPVEQQEARVERLYADLRADLIGDGAAERASGVDTPDPAFTSGSAMDPAFTSGSAMDPAFTTGSAMDPAFTTRLTAVLRRELAQSQSELERELEVGPLARTMQSAGAALSAEARDLQPAPGFRDRLMRTLQAEQAVRTGAPVRSSADPVAPTTLPTTLRIRGGFRSTQFRLSMLAAAAALVIGAGAWMMLIGPNGAGRQSAPQSKDDVATLATAGSGAGSIRGPQRPDMPDNDPRPDTGTGSVPGHAGGPAVDLSTVHSVPEELLGDIEAFSELRGWSHDLERELADLAGSGASVTAEKLDDRHPFLERTFEETLGGL